MTRRHVLFLTAVGLMLAVAALGFQKPAAAGKLLLLEWAHKANLTTPPVAVLIEMGVKDATPRDWSGKAEVTGAKVVHREGYRFRTKDGDTLTDPDGWKAASHRPLRLAPDKMKPQVAKLKLDPIATVGVVLHLADAKPDGSITITPKEGEKAALPLKDVLAGKPHSVWDGKAVVRLVSTATPVVTAKTEDDFPAACYGPDGTLWVAYVSYHVKDDTRRIEAPQLKEQPKDFKELYTPEFRDQLFVKYLRDGKWSEPIAVTGANEDLVRCAIAVSGLGETWVAYSARRENGCHVYARQLTLKPAGSGQAQLGIDKEHRLSTNAGPNVNPVMASYDGVDLLLAYQSAAKGPFTISMSHYQKGQWKDTDGADQQGRNFWHPALVTGPTGQKFAAAFDSGGDDYDVFVAAQGFEGRVGSSSRFEARPSLAYDAKGRLWIAFEEGPEQWGKDFGAFEDSGNPLYFARTVKVVCLADGKLMRPAAELPPLAPKAKSPAGGQNVEAIPRYAHPKIGIDGKGRVWLTYRQKFGSRYTTHPGSYWLTFARRLDGDKWSEPVELHHSCGLLDHRPVLLPHKAGGLLVVHNTDGRYTTPEVIDNQVYLSYVDLPGEPAEPKLVPNDPAKKDPKLVKAAEEERAAVKRIRAYRVEAGGKKLQLLRGEFHRHTEISWDGGPDGSLEDMFRYGIDAAAMDWIGNGDHDAGAGREYPWWLIQKFTDAYHVPGAFTGMFTYERSVPYPMGHRNCVFAQRGVRTLPRLAAEPGKAVAGVHPDDTKMLYRYLHEHDGICAVHTSATGMGTDWRDHDSKVEPFVEIYQGLRMTNEYENAPRAGYDAQSGKLPTNIGGWQPLGFINHALAKGHRLAFQASSDHFSTHISYCIVLAEKNDRKSILDAMKKRHVYGATDDIILDVRCGQQIMGDEFKLREPPALQITAVGTGPIARVVILKDGEVVETLKPGKAEFRGSWTDPKPTAGVHYYYVRVEQADGELAWGSPMWIEYVK